MLNCQNELRKEATRGYRIHINILNGIIYQFVYICTNSERSSFISSRSLRIESLQYNGAQRGAITKRNMSRDDLNRTKNIRSGYRAAATRMGREISETIADNGTSQDQLNRLKIIQRSLEERIVVLRDLDTILFGLIDPSEIEINIEVSSEVEIKIKEYIAKCQQVLDDQIDLESLLSSQRSPQRPASHVEQNEIQASYVFSEPNAPPATENGCSNSQRQNWNKVKLPKLELPTFNGEITKFFSFWDSFDSMVGTNEDLSSIDKFNYLQRSLRGEAQTALEGLPIRNRTYQATIELLKERFGNTQKIISMHMDRLVKLKSCESDNIVALRTIYDQINIQIRGLEALGINHEKYGCLLVPIIMAILPNQISLQIARNTTTDIWTLNGLMDIFKR